MSSEDDSNDSQPLEKRRKVQSANEDEQQNKHESSLSFSGYEKLGGSDVPEGGSSAAPEGEFFERPWPSPVYCPSSSTNQLEDDNSNDGKLLVDIPITDKVEKNFSERDQNHFVVKPGDIIADRTYLVIRKLGTGTYSNVWMACDLRKDSFVALKITKRGDKIMESSAKEVEFLKKIHEADGPGKDYIIALRDTIVLDRDTNECVMMVFDVCGPNILRLMQSINSKLPIEIVRKISKQLLLALDHFHTKCGIIHCDLKLENIMIELSRGDIEKLAYNSEYWRSLGTMPAEDEKKFYDFDLADPDCPIHIKVTDFGISCYEHEVPIKRMVQSCCYRAPEVFLKSKFDRSADMWSFACVVFEMATGQLMFPCNDGPSPILETKEHLSLFCKLLGRISLSPFHGSRNEHIHFDEGMFNGTVKYEDGSSLRKYLEWSTFVEPEDATQLADFLLTILKFDPTKRATANEALQHPFLLPYGGRTPSRSPEKQERQRTPSPIRAWSPTGCPPPPLSPEYNPIVSPEYNPTSMADSNLSSIPGCSNPFYSNSPQYQPSSPLYQSDWQKDAQSSLLDQPNSPQVSPESQPYQPVSPVYYGSGGLGSPEYPPLSPQYTPGSPRERSASPQLAAPSNEYVYVPPESPVYCPHSPVNYSDSVQPGEP